MNFLTQKRSKTLLKEKPHIEHNKVNSDFYYQEIAMMTGSGGWRVNFKEKTTYLDPAARRILEIPKEYIPSLNKLIQFYAPGKHQEKAKSVFMACSKGVAFNDTVKMITTKNRAFWVRAIGKPIYNGDEEIIGIRGVFQDIDDEFNKKKKLERSLRTIAMQNQRMMNFANLVTHNIRSQASNFQLTLELLKTSESGEESKELTDSLSHISESLNNTVSHLNDIVSIQSKALQETKRVYFKDSLVKAKVKMNKIISKTDTEIFSDFTEVTGIHYNEEFMEKIMTTILGFMISNKAPDKVLVIDICAFKENDKKYLLFKDNGTGKKLTTDAETIFQIESHPETINNNERLELFILKNQIEVMQGNIFAQQEAGKGLDFKIQL